MSKANPIAQALLADVYWDREDRAIDARAAYITIFNGTTLKDVRRYLGEHIIDTHALTENLYERGKSMIAVLVDVENQRIITV